jgi:hypothetical protein
VGLFAFCSLFSAYDLFVGGPAAASLRSTERVRPIAPPCAASGTQVPAYILYQRLLNDDFSCRMPEAEHFAPGDNTREVAIGVSMTTKLMPIIFI